VFVTMSAANIPAPVKTSSPEIVPPNLCVGTGQHLNGLFPRGLSVNPSKPGVSLGAVLKCPHQVERKLIFLIASRSS